MREVVGFEPVYCDDGDIAPIVNSAMSRSVWSNDYLR